MIYRAMLRRSNFRALWATILVHGSVIFGINQLEVPNQVVNVGHASSTEWLVPNVSPMATESRGLLGELYSLKNEVVASVQNRHRPPPPKPPRCPPQC